eukprot:14325409-Ditylum_brightwellii.AAC.1
MSAVGGLCMMETIGAKRSSVCHQAQQEGLKQATIMGIPTEKPVPEKHQTKWNCCITRTRNGHRATLKNWLTTRGLIYF